MTELNQNTVAVTKVAYKDASAQEQAARHQAQMARDLKFLQARGLGKGAAVDYGYLSGAVIKDDHMVAKSGKIGHRYSFALYVTDPKTGVADTKFFNFQTFSQKMMKLFDGIVAAKTEAKKNHNTKITASIYSGINANGYRDVAWADLYINKKQVKLA